jgi:hypothetical protein
VGQILWNCRRYRQRRNVSAYFTCAWQILFSSDAFIDRSNLLPNTCEKHAIDHNEAMERDSCCKESETAALEVLCSTLLKKNTSGLPLLQADYSQAHVFYVR